MLKANSEKLYNYNLLDRIILIRNEDKTYLFQFYRLCDALMKYFWSSLAGVFHRAFGLDLRSLALFRVSLGAILLMDLWIRAQDLVAHYTDDGMLPRDVFLESFAGTWNMSLHFLNGTAGVQMFLFLIAAVFAVMLMVGYKTRLATLMSWILLMSLHDRNPIILQGGDVLLRLILFWAIFLPLGEVYSLDRVLSGVRKKMSFFSLAVLGMLVQVILMYGVTVLQKTGDAWSWDTATAVYYALNVDFYTKPFGEFLLGFPELLPWLTRLTLVLEVLGCVLLLVPGWTRMMGVVMLLGLQANFYLTLEVGLFPFISSVAVLPFIPSAVWNKWKSWIGTPRRTKLKIYYDGECGFCFRSVHFLRTFFLVSETQIGAAVPNTPEADLMYRENSWVVVDHHGKMHTHFAGWIALSKASPILFVLVPLWILPPVKWIGDKIYRLVARSRLQICDMPPQQKKSAESIPRWYTSWITAVFAFFCIGYSVTWALSTLPDAEYEIPSDIKPIGRILNFNQQWKMFAPNPPKSSGWFVISAKQQDGRRIDLFREGNTVSFEVPENPAQEYPHHRWRKFFTNLRKEKNQKYRKPYTDYLCKSWNKGKRKSKKIQLVEIYYMKRRTLMKDNEKSVPEKILLHKQKCR